MLQLTVCASAMCFAPPDCTEKERDQESQLDSLGARYYGSALGRFTSPEPLWVKADRLVDPQRLNLYAYGRNNPLRLSDATGMDGTVRNCPGSMTVTQCFAVVQSTVPKDDRSHIHLVNGNGENGFQKGQYGITVDADYKSLSGNFQALQTAANDHSGIVNINIMEPGQTFSSLVGAQRGNNIVTVPFKSVYGQDNYVSSRDALPGLTAFALIGNALKDTIYSTGPLNQIYVADDEPTAQMSATLAHELRHAVLGQFGKAVANGIHGGPGVDASTKAAEDEALKNNANQ